MAKGNGDHNVPAKTSGTDLEVVDFGEYAGAGLEDIQRNEQLTPFLRMLQGLSPELNPSNAEYVDGSQMGMIINTASQQLYPGKTGVDLLVCARSYHYGAWVPRDKGGGFRGMYSPQDPLVQELLAKFGRFKALPFAGEEGEELQLVETGQLYVLYGPPDELTEDTAEAAIVSFSKTAMPVYQEYLSRHMRWRWPQPDGTAKPAALWSYKWRLTTRSDKNSKGEYYNWSMNLAPPATRFQEALIRPDQPLWQKGAEMYKLYNEGKIKPDYSKDNPADDKVPF